MPRVSVIMPSYNHEKFVAEAIRSVLDQTYQDFEIVIADDGSTDGTVAQIRTFRDPRIKLICLEKNRGAPAAARICIEQARGEYVSVLSSDDIYLSHKLETQLRFLEAHAGICAAFSFARIIDEGGKSLPVHPLYTLFRRRNRTRHEWLNRFFYDGNCLCHTSALIRRACYDKIGYYDERFAQLPDFDFWIRLCMNEEIHVIPEELVGFRILSGEANASGMRPETTVRATWEHIQALRHYLTIRPLNEFRRIFPGDAESTGALDDEDIPFLIAQLALKANTPVHRFFAADTLFNLFADRRILRRIEGRYGFGYTDLYAITGEHGPYDLVPGYISRLFADTGSGYSAAQSVSHAINPIKTSFSLEFDLPTCGPIRSLRWDPVENRLCRVKISSISLRDRSGRGHAVDPDSIASNGTPMPDGGILFETFDPQFFLPAKGDTAAVRIEGELHILSGIQAERKQINPFRPLFRVFWPSAGGYTEACSRSIRVIADGELHYYELLLPRWTGGALRIAPANVLAYVELYSLELRVADTRGGPFRTLARFAPENGFAGLTAEKGTARLADREVFGFFAAGKDPHIYLTGISCPDRTLSVNMRVIMRLERVIPPVLRHGTG